MSTGFAIKTARAPKREAISLGAKVIVQVLFATGKTMTLEGLRGKLREWFLGELDESKRALAAMTTLELAAALLAANVVLQDVGLQFQLSNGTVALSTTHVAAAGARDYICESTGETGTFELTPSALEVLSCIAFKQPVSQAEIDRLFGGDKRSLVLKLRSLRLVEEFPGEDGRLRFATTAEFLRRFGLRDLEDLRKQRGADSGLR